MKATYDPVLRDLNLTPSPVKRRRRQQWVGLLYISPAIALVLVFFVIPLAMTAWMSLYNWPLLGRRRFIGLENYLTLWNDHGFWNSLQFTAIYTVAATIGLLAVGMALALFVERPRPGVNLYRTAFFLPVVVGFASASLVWSWLTNVDSGLFSPLAQRLGLTSTPFNINATFIPCLLVGNADGHLENGRLLHGDPDERPSIGSCRLP